MTRIEAQPKLSSEIIYSRSIEALAHLHETRSLVVLGKMLSNYAERKLIVGYRRQTIVTPHFRSTTVALVNKRDVINGQIINGATRLNFFCKVWGSDPEMSNRELREGKRVVSPRDQYILDVNTVVQDYLDSRPTIQHEGISFLYPNPSGQGVGVYSLLFNEKGPMRTDVRFQIAITDLLAMMGEVLRLAEKPRFSPALQR